MSRLDSSIQKATKNILHSLYESALSPVTEASGASTQQQINRDKPEDAPKETKDALIKKVQNDKIPTKTLKEDENGVLEKIKSGEKVYLRDPDGEPMVVEYTDNYPQPEEYDQGYEQGDLDVAKAAAEEGNVWIAMEVDESNVEQTGTVIAYIYGEQELYDFLSDKREVKVVSRLEESAECKDKSLKEGIEEIQNQIAELQDYLDNTPDIADDEKQSIQDEINELLDEVNYYDNEVSMEVEEPSDDDLHLGESALTEAPNPENAEINKKILNTIRTKRDTEPRYKSDLEAAGLTVEPDKYNDSWSITGTNGRKITKDNFLGGKNAEFNANNNKVVDYYNKITKEDPNFDKKSYWTRENKFGKKINQKGRKYNFDTHEYEDKQIYSTKEYNQRQRDSRKYDFNNLRDGSKNIKDYRDAAKTAKDEEPGSWSNNYNNDKVKRANMAYKDFINSISSKINDLQDRIKRAEERRDRDLKAGEEAEKRRQEILNNARAKRNKGGNV